MSSLRFFAFVLFPLTCVSAQPGYFDVSGGDFLEKTRFIFVGKLIQKESVRSEDGRFILTRHVFQVTDRIKGDPGGHLEITEYGGTVGNVTMTVSHGPHYAPGETYLVFSYPDLLDHNRTLAGPLGQFRIIEDRSGIRSIRIYPTHPLLEALGKETPALQDLETFSNRLRTRLASLTR